MSKRLLILRACGHSDEKEECNGIAGQAKLYGLDVHDYCPKNEDELYKELNKNTKYDFIYLSSHGDENGFQSDDKTLDIAWSRFGSILCESDCMEEDCIIMLSCCRGGLNQVAYDLFNMCERVSYVVGPRQSLDSLDMLICFNIFLYNNFIRGIDPIVSCKKIEAATDVRFKCFDRLETQMEMSYIHYMKSQFIQTYVPPVVPEIPPEVIEFRNLNLPVSITPIVVQTAI